MDIALYFSFLFCFWNDAWDFLAILGFFVQFRFRFLVIFVSFMFLLTMRRALQRIDRGRTVLVHVFEQSIWHLATAA
jgi:hypothetical protein